MFAISGSQIRAARGLLDWSQDNLAERSKVSRTTVQSIESGMVVRDSLVMSIWKTLRDHGVEFLENNGVRQRVEGLRDFVGSESCNLLFDDVAKTIRTQGGNFICSIDNEAMLTRPTGMGQLSNLQRLEQVQKLTQVKCLLAGQAKWDFPRPSFPVRQADQESSVIRASYFCYGNRLVFGYLDSMKQFAFVLFENEKFARNCQVYFLARWDKAASRDKHFD